MVIPEIEQGSRVKIPLPAFAVISFTSESAQAQHSYRLRNSALAATAVSIPCRIANGGGGQPGTETSTGMTFDTAPQLA